MAITIVSDNKRDRDVLREIMPKLKNAGVPEDARWRSLILYFLEMREYTHFTEAQKSDIQALLASTLAARDYSEERLHSVLEAYKEIISRPYKDKIDELMREALEVISSFRELLASRYGNIKQLETTSINMVEEEGGTIALVQRLRGAFNEVKEFLENDMRDLEHQALRDGLTNIANRRAFEAFLERELARWGTEGQSMALAMFDIDHFKKFNDEHGHRIGDQVLKLVAQFLDKRAESFLEKGDKAVAARYGGEEFSLVVSGPGAAQLPEAADEVRDAIQGFNFVIRDTNGNVIENNLHITVSAGVAACRRDWTGNLRENLVDMADKALYMAKGSGRNRTMVHTPASKTGFRLFKLNG